VILKDKTACISLFNPSIQICLDKPRVLPPDAVCAHQDICMEETLSVPISSGFCSRWCLRMCAASVHIDHDPDTKYTNYENDMDKVWIRNNNEMNK